MEEDANLGTDAGGDVSWTPHGPARGGAAGGCASAVRVALPPAWRVEVQREIRVDELKELVRGGEVELSALLRRYGIPEERAGEVWRKVKELVREELGRRGLPEEEWLVDALSRILVRMARGAGV
jgi:hypothetical protein